MSKAAVLPSAGERILVELQQHEDQVCFDGDAGVIGRVASSANAGACLDIKGKRPAHVKASHMHPHVAHPGGHAWVPRHRASMHPHGTFETSAWELLQLRRLVAVHGSVHSAQLHHT